MTFQQQKHINTFVKILEISGVKNVIISPGSRNAPLIQAFVSNSQIKSYNIIDERSAGYYALGMAIALQEPVAMVCTSGTAAINFAPAIAEAYYQQIPLIAITADRPIEKINQREGQSIQQINIFGSHIKKEITLPQLPLDKDMLSYSQRIVFDAFHKAIDYPKGPIHINVPLREPLYLKTDEIYPIKKINFSNVTKTLSNECVNRLVDIWNTTKKVLILIGTHTPNKKLENLLITLSEYKQVVILTEKTSNLHSPLFHHHIDRLLATMDEQFIEEYKPNLLITVGKEVVSKKIKFFLKESSNLQHWHVEENTDHIDTYHHLTELIPLSPIAFFSQIAEKIKPIKSDFSSKWKALEKNAVIKHNQFSERVKWSDYLFYQEFFKFIPKDGILHFGNSTPIRYALLFKETNICDYYANRGTSGIDGNISTASGFAMQTQKMNTLIVGDISFLYDSNGLWNQKLPNNLRIIVMNNQGGNIFRIISGPSSLEELSTHFETKQEINIENIAHVFNLPFYRINEQKEVYTVINKAYEPHDHAVIIEVKTSGIKSSEVMKSYFEYLKK